jgi:D-aspartate ligase
MPQALQAGPHALDFDRSTVAYVLGLSRGGLSGVRSLGRLGIRVRGLDWSPAAPGFRSRYCAARVCPDPARDPVGLAALLVEEGRRLRRPAILIPSVDSYALFISRYREVLAPYFLMALPPAELLEALVDKHRLYELAERTGVPYPRTWYPRSAAEATPIAGEVMFPAFVKPHHGHLWRKDFGLDHKGFKVHDAAELTARLAQADAAGHAVLVQEFLEGPDTGILLSTVYIDQSGTSLAVSSRRRIRQQPPDAGIGSLVECVHLPNLEKLAAQFCLAVGYRGIAGLEFKVDPRDGRPKLLDFNARLPRTNQLVTDCGVNLALLQYLDLTGQRPQPVAPTREIVRWLSLPEDLLSFAEYRRRGELGWGEWLRSLGGVRSFATFAWDDPWPLLHATGYGRQLAELALLVWRSGRARG